MCGASRAETSVSSSSYYLSIDRVVVKEDIRKLEKVINGGSNLSNQCKCDVVIHRPDILVKWIKPTVGAVTMSWGVPDGGPIDHYVLSYWKKGSSNKRTVIVPGNKQAVILRDLELGAWLSQVMAVDGKGAEGKWTEVIEVVI